jgi:hypothetical protein
MKVALLKTATAFWMGMVDSADAALIDEEFELGAFEPGEGGSDNGADAPEPPGFVEGAIIRVHFPATVETGSWFQQSQLDPTSAGHQFVAMRFPVLLEVSRARVRLGAVEVAELFDVADSTTAIVSAAGVEPAGDRLQSSEGLVQKYLTLLVGLGVKPAKLPSGRQKVPRA